MQYMIVNVLRRWCDDRIKAGKINNKYKQSLIDLRDACVNIMPFF